MTKEEEKNTDAAPETSEGEQQPVKKGKLGKKLAILGVVATVIGVECGVAFYFLKNVGTAVAEESQSAETTDSKAEHKTDKKEHAPAKHEGKSEGKEGEHGSEADKDPNEEIEVVLGEFSVTTFQPATNTTLRIEFNLYGTITAKDKNAFLTALEENQHRFRDQILVIVRSAEINDLTDAGLGLVKRKIMEKTNRMIGTPMLHSVIFSDFSFVEQ